MRGSGELSIGLIGAGLIGASFVDAIAKAGVANGVLILDPNADNAAATAAMHPGGTIVAELADLADCDIVLICSPPGTIAEFVRALAAYPCVVIDAGSVKGALVRSVADANPRFVPAHPLSGGVSSGPGKAEAAIITARPIVLTPYPGIDNAALAAAEAFLGSLGAALLKLDADAHDRIMALLSHLPHLFAYGLVAALEDMAGVEDPETLRAMLPNSFLTVTRFAESDARLWRDVFQLNRESIGGAGDAVRAAMASLLGAVPDDAAARLEALGRLRRSAGDAS
jgi:cyclohexadieny/prephenate dehydrogenase